MSMTRAAVASVIFVLVGFTFFIAWAVTSFLIYAFTETSTVLATNLKPASQAEYMSIVNNLNMAFQWVWILLFVLAFIIYLFDALRKDRDIYFIDNE